MIIVSSICLICMTLLEIFKMKYKKDMFVEYLKHYDTTSTSDDVIIKMFNLGGE